MAESEAPPPLELAFNITEQIRQLRKELKNLEETRDYLIDSARKDGIVHEGPYHLTEKITRTLEIDRALFIQRYPDTFQKIAKIPIKEAEALLGRKVLESVSTEKPRSTYVVTYKDEVPLSVRLQQVREEKAAEARGWSGVK